jgi:phasin family protein
MEIEPETLQAVKEAVAETQAIETTAKSETKDRKRASTKAKKPVAAKVKKTTAKKTKMPATSKAKKPSVAKAKTKPQAKSGTKDGAAGVENVIKIGAKMSKNAFKESAESLQEGFEKFSKDYEKMVGFQKEVAEALVESATIASKGMETINKTVMEYSQTSFEDMFAATKAIVASKSLQEAVEKQTAFTKSAFESYVAEMTKVRDLALGTAKDASAPVQKKVDAAASMVMSAAA